MAISYSGLDIALLAGEDLSTYQYHYVVQSGATVVLATGATAIPLGILQNAPADGGHSLRPAHRSHLLPDEC